MYLSSTVASRYEYVERCKSFISETGVPQGSVLGPLLFLLYVNGIITTLNANVFAYADDIILLKSQDSMTTDGRTLWSPGDYVQEEERNLYSTLNTY